MECRLLPAGFAPSAIEQVFLERLNDARANPPAYGAAIGVDLSDVAAAAPLAFNPLLIQAARLHAQDMNARAYFSHDTPEGLDPGERLSNAGFAWLSWGESLAGGSAYPGAASALRGLIVDAGVPDLGHRRHLLAIDAIFKDQNQVGIGIVQNGSGPLTNYYVIDTAQGLDTRPFLTGVVYNDANNNRIYEIGEGLGGVSVAVSGVGTVATWASGGYSVQLNPGTYTVTFSGGGLPGPLVRVVTVGAGNVRLNATSQEDDSIRKLYQQVLKRTPSAAEVAGWGPILLSGGIRAVASGIENSAEARTRLVRSWYVTHLGRSPVNAEERGWVNLLTVGGLREEDVLAGILGSAEYYHRAAVLGPSANADEDFIRALYTNLLNRPASAAEVQAYVSHILPVYGRQQTAFFFLRSAEFRARMVRSYYADILKRQTPPTPAEVAGWVFSPYTLTGIRVGFESSAEFFANG